MREKLFVVLGIPCTTGFGDRRKEQRKDVRVTDRSERKVELRKL